MDICHYFCQQFSVIKIQCFLEKAKIAPNENIFLYFTPGFACPQSQASPGLFLLNSFGVFPCHLHFVLFYLLDELKIV